MGIEIDLSDGALDPDAVWVQYHTLQDERVRPSHAALDGRVFRVGEIDSPAPPLGFGCRCYLSYVSAPNSKASELLPEAPSAPTTRGASYADYLSKELGDKTVAAVMAAVANVEQVRQLSVAYLALHRLRPSIPATDARDLARMIVEAHGP